MTHTQPADFAAIAGALTGDPNEFFREYWQRRPRPAPAIAGSPFRYEPDQFFAHLSGVQPPPYASVSVEQGSRRISYHASLNGLEKAISSGSICYIKISRYWESDNIPDEWKEMRSLYSQLYRKTSSIYMSPGGNENVDLFLAGPNSSLGTHFDDVEVFSLQLNGSRVWHVSESQSFEHLRDIATAPGFSSSRVLNFESGTQDYRLRPGEGLYIPSYTMHRVDGGGAWSISLNMGMNAYNEFDLLSHILADLRASEYYTETPFADYPPAVRALHADSRGEMIRRVRNLLDRLESRSQALIKTPLRLPPHLRSSEL